MRGFLWFVGVSICNECRKSGIIDNMTYQEYSVHMRVCEFLGREPIGQYKEVYDFLNKLWEGMEIVVESVSNRIVLQKEEEWFFEQDNKIGYLWCQDDMVWSFFRNDMGMEVTETQEFIKTTVEEHLRCKVETPLIIGRNWLGEGGRTPQM